MDIEGNVGGHVSILVLMDLCIKTALPVIIRFVLKVSILVLMDLCIKTKIPIFSIQQKY